MPTESKAAPSVETPSTDTKSKEPEVKAESFLARCLRRWIAAVDMVTSTFLGGPRCIKFAHVINFQKCTTLFLCAAMMWRSKNYSATATTYTALHGSYGLCWYLKHLVFPDPRWESKMTVGSAVAVFASVLGPYWVIAYNAIMSDAHRTNVQLCAATIVYAVGLALMTGADAQKYFVLRARKGLITDGFFARTRNPNYLGEVMIYGSFAYVSAHSSSWVIVGSVWSFLFLPWMINKDRRMSRHAGWNAYRLLQMSAPPSSRNRRPYPPQDTSKHYTEVPPRNVKQHSALYKMVKRLEPEIAFGELEPAEQIGVLVVALLVLVLAIGGPVYLVRYALS